MGECRDCLWWACIGLHAADADVEALSRYGYCSRGDPKAADVVLAPHGEGDPFRDGECDGFVGCHFVVRR